MRGKRAFLIPAAFLILGLLAALVVSSVAFGADVDSRRHQEWVDVPTESDRTVRTFVVYPEVDGPAPAVIVIHENRGLTDWVRSVADQLAAAGYVALAPDLLSGAGPNGGGTEAFASSDDARSALYQLSADRVTSDLDAVAEYAGQLTATSEKLAVAGFCWGGGQAFGYAAHNPTLDAAFVFYGRAPDERELANVKAPVYGFYGGNDFRITGAVPQVADAMKKADRQFDPEVYEGAGHGFMRAGEADDAKPADKQGRTAAWERWKTILGRL